ncbi:MAG TPA: AtpZ/AtpI family protein [Nocardioidaceae bacterium]|jgi:F0F1-type ATP synthase assembly protein I|nr:AtpZ/AtpI family protein [Nocardioidaceae bacterium]
MSDQPARQLSVWTLVGIGTYNVTCLLAGLGLGWWADSRFGTTPFLTLVGLAAGIAAGVGGSWVRIKAFLHD